MSRAQTATPADTTLVLTHIYQAPRERVFAAWLDEEVLRRIMAPEGCSVAGVALDARVGGLFSITLNTPGGEMTVRGEYLEIRQPDLIAFTWKWDEDEPSQEHESCVTLEFRDREGATELVLTHERLRNSESRDSHARGWESIAENLAAIVAGSSAKRSFTITGMDLSGYMVKDAQRAIAFYRDAFGIEPVRLYPDNRGAEYELPDGTTFGLWGGAGDVVPFQPSNGILFAVDDIDAAVRALEARGIAVKRMETPNCFMAWLNDTEGNSIVLHKRKTH